MGPRAAGKRGASVKLPPPPLPEDCDLTGLPFLPLETDRLLNSDFILETSDAEFRAGVMLWVKSWGRIPAASLPSDDGALARLLGLSPAQWARVKAKALRNWVRHADGRLYHPVLTRLALGAWIDRLKARLKSGKGHAARWGRQINGPQISAQLDAAQAMLAAMAVAMPGACQAKAEAEASQEALQEGAREGGASAAPLKLVVGAKA